MERQQKPIIGYSIDRRSVRVINNDHQRTRRIRGNHCIPHSGFVQEWFHGQHCRRNRKRIQPRTFRIDCLWFHVQHCRRNLIEFQTNAKISLNLVKRNPPFPPQSDAIVNLILIDENDSHSFLCDQVHVVGLFVPSSSGRYVSYSLLEIRITPEISRRRPLFE
jgi:hypothetical protein